MALVHPFFLLLALLFSPELKASSVFNQQVNQAYTETIKLRIANGRSLIRKELQANPRNAVALLVENQQDFLTWCIQQDPAVYDNNIKAQENRLQQLAEIREKSPWVDYSQAEIRMHLGLTKLLHGNKLAAAWDLRLAYLQYQSNAKRYPSFLPNKKSLGVLQVLIGSVPDSYKGFLSIIGIRGDIKTGMAHLQAATSRENPFHQEAILLQALLIHLLDPEKDKSASSIICKLALAEPDNLLYNFVAIHILKKTKQGKQALALYLNRPNDTGYLAFPYLHHMAADLYLYKGDFTQSIRENSLFLQQHKGEHYLKATQFKLYLANWLNHNSQQASYHYARIGQQGKVVMEEDLYAQRFTEQNTQSNRHLLLARLQSDGGYYLEALASLNQLQHTGETDQTVKAEYFYRKARIYHGLEDLSQAKRYYKQTITACKNVTLYFAPNAALHLGYIYQDEQNPSLAATYFRKALAYKGHAYKNSIDAKAKLALHTL